MKTKHFLGAALSLILIAVFGFYMLRPYKLFAPTQPLATPASIADLITVDAPLPNSIINSTTIEVTGKARGSWYFEASAPMELRDASGTVVATSHVTAKGDWMTTNFVPFSGTITIPQKMLGKPLTLVLKNDNPSGDPAKQKELRILLTDKN